MRKRRGLFLFGATDGGEVDAIGRETPGGAHGEGTTGREKYQSILRGKEITPYGAAMWISENVQQVPQGRQEVGEKLTCPGDLKTQGATPRKREAPFRKDSSRMLQIPYLKERGMKARQFGPRTELCAIVANARSAAGNPAGSKS